MSALRLWLYEIALWRGVADSFFCWLAELFCCSLFYCSYSTLKSSICFNSFSICLLSFVPLVEWADLNVFALNLLLCMRLVSFLVPALDDVLSCNPCNLNCFVFSYCFECSDLSLFPCESGLGSFLVWLILCEWFRPMTFRLVIALLPVF